MAEGRFSSRVVTEETGPHSGKTYQYLDVPASMFPELMTADSLGTYDNKNIRDNHHCGQL
jgi:hypothetical protein